MKKDKMRMFLFAFVLVTAFLFQTNTVKAAGGRVYVSVEKFTLGQGYLVAPMEVSFTEGENYAQVFDRVMQMTGYKYEKSGELDDEFYLIGIEDADNGVIDIPSCIQSMEPSGVIQPPTNESAKEHGNGANTRLEEFDYHQMSGWYYLVNGKNPQVGMSGCKAKDGDVVRYQFTLYGYGSDLGCCPAN